jgi:hypothetical protein
MIEPTAADVGRQVVYTGNRYPGGQPELGRITSFNSHCVFVRYGDDKHSKGTSRQDLEWATAIREGE